MTAVEFFFLAEYVIGPLHRHKYSLTNYYQAKNVKGKISYLTHLATTMRFLCYLFLLWVPMSVL